MAPTVLIVDHVADLREIYRTALTIAGFTVLEASDGASALTACRSHQPAAIVLHIGLPDIDGVAWSRQVQDHLTYPDAPIVAITGWPARAQELRDSGMFGDVLIKPVLPDQLIAAVQRLLPTTAPPQE